MYVCLQLQEDSNVIREVWGHIEGADPFYGLRVSVTGHV